MNDKGLRIYTDSGLVNMITLENDFTLPDSETDINGDTGATKKALRYVAIEQTKLEAGMNDSDVQTVLDLVAARFADTTLNVLIIGTEKLKILSDFGTDHPTVQRGYKGTSKATHNIGDPVYLCYNVTSGAIVSYDNDTPPDEAGWMTFCLAPGETPDENYNSHPTPLSLGAFNYNQSVIIERKLVVPASTPPVAKTDLLLKATGNLKEYVPAP